MDKLKDTVRDITKRTQGVNLQAGDMSTIFGWAMYKQYIARWTVGYG